MKSYLFLIIALVDEIEKPARLCQRFTGGFRGELS